MTGGGGEGRLEGRLLPLPPSQFRSLQQFPDYIPSRPAGWSNCDGEPQELHTAFANFPREVKTWRFSRNLLFQLVLAFLLSSFIRGINVNNYRNRVRVSKRRYKNRRKNRFSLGYFKVFLDTKMESGTLYGRSILYARLKRKELMNREDVVTGQIRVSFFFFKVYSLCGFL